MTADRIGRLRKLEARSLELTSDDPGAAALERLCARVVAVREARERGAPLPPLPAYEGPQDPTGPLARLTARIERERAARAATDSVLPWAIT